MLPCVLVVIPGFGGICVILATHPQPPVSHLDRRGPPSGPLPPQLRVWKCSDFLEKLGSGCHTTGHRQPWPPHSPPCIFHPAKGGSSLPPGGAFTHELEAHGGNAFPTLTQTPSSCSCHSSSGCGGGAPQHPATGGAGAGPRGWCFCPLPATSCLQSTC